MEMSSAQILQVAGVLSINMEMLSAIDITKSDNKSVMTNYKDNILIRSVGLLIFTSAFQE